MLGVGTVGLGLKYSVRHGWALSTFGLYKCMCPYEASVVWLLLEDGVCSLHDFF
jgi:hypothetical protein